MQDPNYVAPEQLGGDKPIDAKASTYQLGAMLFHLLAGKPAHTGNDKKQIALAHFREPFPSLKSRQPFLRPGIFSLVADCTQRDPEERPAMADVAQRIEDVLEGRDEPDKKAGGAPRSRRRRRRRR